MIGAAAALGEARMERAGRSLVGAWVAAGRDHLAKALLRGAEAANPAVLDERFRARVSEITVKTVMAVMDQQGIAHCALCASRVDLRVKNGSRFCPGHQRDGGDRE